MSSQPVSLAGPWVGGQAFTLDGLFNGMPNLADWRGAIDTESQQLSGELRITASILSTTAKDWDFYAVSGSLGHGVSHGGSSYDPSKNWVSVGYYATSMTLILDLADHPATAELWDAGPTSTVGSESVGWNIGGNLSGGEMAGQPILQAGISAGFGTTFSAPDVRFGMSKVGQTARWDVSLPGVGFVSPGNPANPMEPSYDGYTWDFGAIYAVPKKNGFRLNVRPTITWEFDYTRGIAYDTKVWAPTDNTTLLTYGG